MGGNSSAFDEGSERERCLTENRKTPKTNIKYYNAPLNDDSCPFLDIPPYIIERMCGFLNLNELSNLSQSCKVLDRLVGEYLRHECCSTSVIGSYREFVRKHGNLISLRERRVLEDINSQSGLGESSVEDEESISRVTRYKMLENSWMLSNVERRVSLCHHSVHVPHRGTGYITTPSDADLDRNVLHVDDVCWLQFSHKFKDVEPGTYSLGVLIKIGENFRMPLRARDFTEWTVDYPGDSKQQKVTVKVSKEWWQKLSIGEIPQSGSENLIVEWEDASQDWFCVSVRGVTVRRRGEVGFEMKDVVCPYWKSGLYFDFLQLYKTN